MSNTIRSLSTLAMLPAFAPLSVAAGAAVVQGVPSAAVWKWATILLCGTAVIALMCIWCCQMMHPAKPGKRRRRKKP